MNAPIDTALATRGPVADTLDQIFEPLRFETLADVFAEYKRDRARMAEIAAMFVGDNVKLVKHFTSANLDSGQYVNTERLFTLETAIKALDADYWQRTLQLTDVVEAMPQKRRDEWHELVRAHDTPPFDEMTVVSTLQDLLVQRHKFFGERVDGIFRALSREHVTNRPEGFSKRMIVAYVVNGGIADYSRCGTLGDLRSVIARFMGRGEPSYYDTSRVVDLAYRERRGEWVMLDGGALRIKVFKNGNAHLEVNPEMAWRLNAVLASLHPNAIPEEHRRRPNRKPPKDFVFYSRPLSFPVVQLLTGGRFDQTGRVFHFAYDAKEKPAYREACDVLTALGGVHPLHKNMHIDTTAFAFDYPAETVVREVAASGVIPDQRAHQFYPTPHALAKRVVAAANIGAIHSVLEPSAGHGALAALLPDRRTTLVEVSALHCKILQSKGWTSVVREDFLRWAPGRRFDRVVMNPPFANGQWVRHLEHAASLVAAGGRIAAVLPTGARDRKILPGWSLSWSEPIPFPGTSIEVTILTADHTA